MNKIIKWILIVVIPLAGLFTGGFLGHKQLQSTLESNKNEDTNTRKPAEKSVTKPPIPDKQVKQPAPTRNATTANTEKVADEPAKMNENDLGKPEKRDIENASPTLISEFFNPYHITGGFTGDIEIKHHNFWMCQFFDEFTIKINTSSEDGNILTLNLKLEAPTIQNQNIKNNFWTKVANFWTRISNFFRKNQNLNGIDEKIPKKLKYIGKYDESINNGYNQNFVSGICEVLTYTPLQDYILSKKEKKQIDDILEIKLYTKSSNKIIFISFNIYLPIDDDYVKLDILLQRLDDLIIDIPSNAEEIATVYRDIAATYSRLGDKVKADKYFEKARNINIQKNDNLL